MHNATIKYTAVLPSEHVNELKALAAQKIIPSVNYGIKRAVEEFLDQSKREIYEKSMMEAVKDAAFLKRTLDTQSTRAARWDDDQ